MAIRLVILVVSALLAWGLWLAEVLWVKGWPGLAWLAGFNWSSVPASAIVIAVSGYVLKSRASWGHRLNFCAISLSVTVASFAIARSALFQIFGPTNIPAEPE